MHVKGLLEMMFEVLSGWIDTFIHDIEGLEAAEGVGGTLQAATQTNGNTPPPSANTSPRGTHHVHTPSGSFLRGMYRAWTEHARTVVSSKA